MAKSKTRTRSAAKRAKSKPRKHVAKETSKTPEPGAADAEHSGQKGYSFESKEQFTVPPALSTLHMLAKFWEPGSAVTILLLLALAWCGMPLHLVSRVLPTETVYRMQAAGAGALTNGQLFLIAVFWRVAYNVFLGVILHYQSKYKFLTRFVQYARIHGGSTLCWYLNKLISGCAGTSDALSKYPDGYNAWLLNMQIVNVILPLDVAAFFMVSMRYFNLESDCSASMISEIFGDTQYLSLDNSPELCTVARYLAFCLGAILGIVSLIGKKEALNVIGHYAWFWGDFFYGIDAELKFEGIFDIAPHPMYTVGYGWMYGSALITRSSAVTALTFICHLMQIGFLEFVENPHIEKLYGPEAPVQKPSRIRNPEQRPSNVLLVKNFDIYRASDWQLVVICVLLMVIFGLVSIQTSEGIYAMSDQSIFAAAMVMRIGGTLLLAQFLRSQARSQFWTKHFNSVDKAFREWKRLYNMIDTMMNLCFYMAAFRALSLDKYATFQRTHGLTALAAVLLAAVSLMLLAYWAERSIYSALGDKGWFYGDFFLPASDKKILEPTYQGIYRYVNNPDVLLGKLWLYGLAIGVMSMDVLIIAFLSHAIAWVFLIAVEEPHMQVSYMQDKIRSHSTALTQKLSEKLSHKYSKLAAQTRARYYRMHHMGA